MMRLLSCDMDDALKWLCLSSWRSDPVVVDMRLLDSSTAAKRSDEIDAVQLDALRMQEGKTKRVCRCGECLHAARRRQEFFLVYK